MFCVWLVLNSYAFYKYANVMKFGFIEYLVAVRYI